MLPCSQLAFLLASSLASEATSPALEAPAQPLPAASFEPLQGTLDESPPKWFISISGHLIQGDFIGPLGEGDDDYSGFGIDFGYTNWNDQLGITLEGGFLSSQTEIQVNTGPNPTDDVDTQRFLIGLRLIDRGSSWWMPYLRGGYMWRMDEGDTISDDGNGFYAGGGFDFFLGKSLRLGPQLLYTESESLDTKEWILGAVLSFGF
jgi:hypothetical protein